MSDIDNVPMSLPIEQRRFFSQMREKLVRLEPDRIPPDTPTNLRVTPIAGGNQITFTRSKDAKGYYLRISTTPSWSAATGMQRDLGDSNVVEDFTGAGSITRYYAVVAYKGDLESPATAPASGVSLGLGVAATLPAPPVSGAQISRSQETGLPVSVQPRSPARLK